MLCSKLKRLVTAEGPMSNCCHSGSGKVTIRRPHGALALPRRFDFEKKQMWPCNAVLSESDATCLKTQPMLLAMMTPGIADVALELPL